MPIIDKIVKGVEVSYEGVFDLHDFLDFLKKWFKSKGYDVTEKMYITKAKGDLKNVTIKWESDRKPTDYDKYIIKCGIDASDLKEGEVDSVKVVQGKVKVTIDADHEKDYDERWRGKPTLNFLRAVYDKFVIEEKENNLVKNLKKDCEALSSEIKGYFNIK